MGDRRAAYGLAPTAVVKRGARGLLVLGEERIELAARDGEVLDATGAGDALAAGFPRRRARACAGSRSTLRREAGSDAVIVVSDEVREAGAVVALETDARRATASPRTRGSQSGSRPSAAFAPRALCRRRSGVLDGKIRVGLSEDELARFNATARKAGPRDLAACVVQGAVGATTVGGTLAVCREVGIRFMGRAARRRSPRLPESTRRVCRSRRARTHERARHLLRDQVVASTCPRRSSCSRHSECRCSAFAPTRCRCSTRRTAAPPCRPRVESASEAAQVAQEHWELGGGGLLLARPPDDSLDECRAADREALTEAARDGVTGQAVTRSS